MAAVTLAGLVSAPGTASADRVRVRIGGGGGVHLHARAQVRVRGPHVVVGGPAYGPYYGRYHRPRVIVRPYFYPRPYFYYPGFYWGFGYGSGCYDACGAVPAYYYRTPRPVAVEAAVAPEPLPRVGLGIFGGGVNVEGNDAGSDLGLIGRLRLSRHFLFEAEVSKTELADGARVDRRIGGALLLDLAPYSALSVYLLGGGGFGQTDVDNGTLTAEQAYGEVGAGLEWRLTRHIALFGDLRAGVRKSNASQDEILLVRGGGGGPTVRDTEDFTRARLGALLYF